MTFPPLGIKNRLLRMTDVAIGQAERLHAALSPVRESSRTSKTKVGEGYNAKAR
jgi:hypothetical protein